MKPALVIFVLLIVFTIGATGQNIDGKLITDRKLTWSDFPGVPDAQSKYDAMTYWNVKYSYRYSWAQSDTVSVAFTVQPLLKEQSWVKKNKKSDELLRHEQGHYDLAIICAELLRQNLAKGIYLKDNYAKVIDSIFQLTMQQVREMEEQYDAETNHMLRRDEQERWNQKIATLLANVPDIYRGR